MCLYYKDLVTHGLVRYYFCCMKAVIRPLPCLALVLCLASCGLAGSSGMLGKGPWEEGDCSDTGPQKSPCQLGQARRATSPASVTAKGPQAPQRILTSELACL